MELKKKQAPPPGQALFDDRACFITAQLLAEYLARHPAQRLVEST